MKAFFKYSFFLILLITSCREDITEITIVDTTTEPPLIEKYQPDIDNIQASLRGFVVNEYNEPVNNAVVKINSEIAYTDAFGQFYFEDISMNSLGEVVNITKDGFFLGSRKFFPLENALSRINIELISKIFTNSFLSSDDITIGMADGSKVEFTANSFITESDGNQYNGAVDIALRWVDPNRPDAFNQMIGSPQGVGPSSLNEEVSLSNLGFIAIEIQGASGEKLNIAKDSKAKLTIPVPDYYQAIAPQEISMWTYYEEYGIWSEEATAKLEGDKYVGEVKHFSFWSCNTSFEKVNLSMILHDDNGNPLKNHPVQLVIESMGYYSYGYTDNDGYVSGQVPVDKVITMNLINCCNSLVWSDEIGPFTTDNDLGVFNVGGFDLSSTTITGDFQCLGLPITEGMIRISFDGTDLYEYIEDSHFDITFTTCEGTEDITVTGIDLSDLTQSLPVTVQAEVTTDIGIIDICTEDIDEYFLINYDGKAYLFNDYLSFQTTSDSIQIYLLNRNKGDGLHMNVFGTNIGVGTYEFSENTLNILFITEWSLNLGDAVNRGPAFDVVEITEYSDYIEGTVSGHFDNDFAYPEGPILITGRFRIKI